MIVIGNYVYDLDYNYLYEINSDFSFLHKIMFVKAFVDAFYLVFHLRIISIEKF